MSFAVGCRVRLCLSLLASGVALALGAREARAQSGTVAAARVISLLATKTSQLSVTVTSGAVQSIPSLTDNAVNNFPSPVVITTGWDVNPGQTNTVNLIAYFTSPAQALSGGATQIPSSRVLAQMTTGLPVAFTAITQNAVGGVGTAGGSLRLFAQNISGPNKKSSRTDNLNLQINLVGFPTLAPGTYSGTLNLRAVTQ
jgi:predicted NBD/HSP70 family sugar kinase